MKKINIAYCILSDPAGKAEYDRNYKQKSQNGNHQEEHNQYSKQETDGDNNKCDNNHSNKYKKEPSAKPFVFRLGLAHFIFIFIAISAFLYYYFLFNISDEEKLFKAMEKCDTLAIARLAKRDPDIIKYARNSEGKSPLEYAADMEQLDLAKVLREKGAIYSVNEADFFKAVEEGEIKKVKRFIAFGADVNAKDNDNGLTPLYKAASEGHTAIAELLKKHGGHK